MSLYFDDDICWCANSFPDEKDFCNNTKCFRHFSNKKVDPSNKKNIYTVSYLKNTEDCPFHNRKGENK